MKFTLPAPKPLTAPPGIHLAFVTAVDYQIAKSSGNPMWSLAISIAVEDGSEFLFYKTWTYISFHVRKKLYEFLRAVRPELQGTDWEFNEKNGRECFELLGNRPFKCTVYDETYNGQVKSRVQFFQPVGDDFVLADELERKFPTPRNSNDPIDENDIPF